MRNTWRSFSLLWRQCQVSLFYWSMFHLHIRVAMCINYTNLSLICIPLPPSFTFNVLFFLLLLFFLFHLCWDIRQYHICCSTWINIIYGIINMFLNQLFNLLLFVILNFNSIITIIYLRKTLSIDTQNQFYLLSL